LFCDFFFGVVYLPLFCCFFRLFCFAFVCFANSKQQPKFTEYGKLLSINEQSKEGMSALHYAAKNNHTHVVEFLLKCGADVNQKSNSGKKIK
jgi:ankyrin repeat protein